MKSYWLNIPVADIKRTRAFYNGIGLEFHQGNSDDNMTGLKVGSQMLMFFNKSVLESRTGMSFTDTDDGNEFIVSFDLESNEEVDQLAVNVERSGGEVLEQPRQSHGYYGFAFKDPDGHLFNVIVM
ncbi:VOC family protein [Macrococcus lamae]|uniref:Glyoxalase n=1 Tax=Macrococcus lamae TaxID=198484 RepID=A0A4R6BU26_9STAP|nr:VOC family protein [Macrococcus lamae]TDM07918.1 glyoxalase [Macrococcus lamae]